MTNTFNKTKKRLRAAVIKAGLHPTWGSTVNVMTFSVGVGMIVAEVALDKLTNYLIEGNSMISGRKNRG